MIKYLGSKRALVGVLGRLADASGAATAVDSMQTSRGVVGAVVVSANQASTSMQDILSTSETVRHSIEAISDA